MKTIVITNPKGGTGKSTISCLLVEYLNYLGKKVNLLDIDPNQSSYEWIAECVSEGRLLSEKFLFSYRIIDTPGINGSSLPYLKEADLILVPFQPQIFDLKVTSKFLELISSSYFSLQTKLIFIVNRWQNTKDQRDAVSQLEEALSALNISPVAPFYLRNRPAIYSAFLEGKATNLFTENSAATLEAQNLIEYILKSLESPK